MSKNLEEMNDLLVVHLEELGLPRDSYDIVPIERLRRIIATRTTQTVRDVPHFPLNIDIELDELLHARAEYNATTDRQKISINDLLVKAAALTLADVPGVNASYTENAIIQHHAADIAVVVAVKNGLVTPIVRNAGGKSVGEISAEIQDLSARARNMRLKPAEYAGGTFSISNLGMFGVTSFGSIINPPHGAILSIGATRQVPKAIEGVLHSVSLMTVTLTCDHRVIDGVTGAHWLQSFKQYLENPALLFR
jgi:pyruvate dehydrogenase E2 component (dihydrolipoamide acetyltransferase)